MLLFRLEKILFDGSDFLGYCVGDFGMLVYFDYCVDLWCLSGYGFYCVLYDGYYFCLGIVFDYGEYGICLVW